MGGVTPTGAMVSVSFYNDRGALPSNLAITVKDGRKVSEKVIGGSGFTRIVETEAHMAADVARSLAAWLLEEGRRG